MADVKSEISTIFDVKYLTFLTSKDDFLVAAKNGPKSLFNTTAANQVVKHSITTNNLLYSRLYS